MVAIMLLERSLGSAPSGVPIYSSTSAETVRLIALVLSTLSMFGDLTALYWFSRMKKKFRHTLIMFLLVADLLKCINYIAFVIVFFIQGQVASGSHYCQANGLFNQYFTEVTDLVILSIVVHMSVQILIPDTTASSEGGLHRFRLWIFGAIVTLPFIDACIAFVNPRGGYALVGAFCNLPIRPFWYRLFLSWVPRYMIAITVTTLTIIVRFKVKGYQKKLAELQPPAATSAPVDVEEIVEEIIEEQDESEEEPTSPTKHMDSFAIADPEKQDMTIITETEIPPLPSEQEPFSSNDFRKFKRKSFMRRQLPALNTGDDATRANSIGAPSIAASSAIFSGRGDFDARPDLRHHSSAFDLHTPVTPSPVTPSPVASRRKSIADLGAMRSLSTTEIPPMPRLERRRSLIDVSSRAGSVTRAPPDRMGSIASRRSSIWDEIDASLEKKVNPNRMSIFTITASEGFRSGQNSPDRDASPTRAPSAYNMNAYQSSLAKASRISSASAGAAQPFGHHRRGSSATSLGNRNSKIYDLARRTMSVISLRGVEPEEDPDSPCAILRRRHRYIQRQLRYMMFYPLLYLALWCFPFALHCAQFSDKYAQHPPLVLVVANTVGLTVFGLVNSLVFCMREKPWTMIPDNDDGTVAGSFRTDPAVKAVRAVWRDLRGYENDDLEFAG